MTSVSIIGSGNVGWHLAHVLCRRGFEIHSCFSRNFSKAETLAKEVKAEPVDQLNQVAQYSDLYLVAVTDDAITAVFTELDKVVVGKTIAHTSGAFPLVTALKKNKSAVFYPLQTFSKAKKVNFSNVPILIEADDNVQEKALETLAMSFSSRVQRISSEQRAQLHVAAVFACNFSNHMLYLSDTILKEKGLNFDLLMPLVNETISKLNSLPPKEAQTGPAMRNDQKTIEKHLALLSDYDQKKIYQIITNHILKTHKTQ